MAATARRSITLTQLKINITQRPRAEYLQLVATDNPSAAHPTGIVLAKGVLAVNDKPDKSTWLDMFRSEEVGAMGLLDLGKIQMFYFTIIIVFSYAVALGSLFVNTPGKISAFPAILDFRDYAVAPSQASRTA